MLAFVVLYNLEQCQYYERQRELATLKVLILTILKFLLMAKMGECYPYLIGVLTVSRIRNLCTGTIIRTVEVDAVMFGIINPGQFLRTADC